MTAVCTVVRAETPPVVGIRVNVDPPWCIPPENLAREVQQRGGRVDATSDMHFDVRLEPVDTHLSMVVDGGDSQGKFAVRTFETGSCAEATQALAVVVALAAHERPAPARPPPDHAEPPAPVAAPPPPATNLTPQPAAPVGSARAPAPRAPWHPYVAAGAYGSSLFRGQFSFLASVGLSRQRTWLPWAELAFSLAPPRTLQGTLGDARFVQGGATLRAAPVALRVAPLEFNPVMGVQAGAIAAKGMGAPVVEAHTRPFVAVLAGARAALRIGKFGLQVGLGAAIPLQRDRFYFRTGEVLYRVPSAAFTAESSLVWFFP